MFWRLILVLSLIVSFTESHAAKHEIESEVEIRAIERAHVVTDEVKKSFKQLLREELSKKSPAKALSACKIKAPKATASVLGGEITGIGRTSHKLRNPNNQPPVWTKSYLDKFVTTSPSEIPKQTLVKLGEKHYGYLEPIVVEPICLNCHGSQINNDVHKAILKEYPQDKAVGFNVGDFRGLLWLEMTTK